MRQVLLFGLLAALFVSFSSSAARCAEFEFYSERPDVLELKPQAAPLPESASYARGKWEDLKRGHAETAALLLETYPDHDLVFLGRDAELLYDSVRLIARNEPKVLARVKLINVSKTNSQSDFLRPYLAEHGISAAELRKGKKYVLIDTGFRGSIPELIRSLFPERASQFAIQLLCSTNPVFPSTRSFLTGLNAQSLHRNPGIMKESVEAAYEYLPRYTYQSTTFAKDPKTGHLEAASLKQRVNAGDRISREEAESLMRDLVSYFDSPETRQLVAKRREQVRALRQSLTEGHRESFRAYAQQLLQSGDPFLESQIRDQIEMGEKNLGVPKNTVTATDLGILEVPYGGGSRDNWDLLAERRPAWRELIRDPEKGLRLWIREGRWKELRQLQREVLDDSFPELLTKQLGKSDPKQSAGFVLDLIEQGDPLIIEKIAEQTVGGWGRRTPAEIVDRIVQRGSAYAIRNLVESYALHVPVSRSLPWIEAVLIRPDLHGARGLQWVIASQYLSRLERDEAQRVAVRLLIDADPSIAEAVDQAIQRLGYRSKVFRDLRIAAKTEDRAKRSQILQGLCQSTLIPVVKD